MPDGAVLGTNWAWILAIVFLVVTVRVILFPVFVKQIKSQRAMQALQPKVKELQEKHKGDRETLQKEMMELYQKEKANPLMGCLPMFLQIPVFLGLFHVLRRLDPDKPSNKTLYGWTVEQFDSAAQREAVHRPDRRQVRLDRGRARQPRRERHHRQDRRRRPGPDHDGDHLPDQPSDDPQDRLGGGPAAADDPAADALRHPARRC